MIKNNYIIMLSILCILLAIVFTGCDLAPAKPEEAFIVYRDLMKNAQTSNARQMLSQDTLNLVNNIEANFHLDQPAENVAFLNMLDPTAPPVILTTEETRATLETRTLKGTNKTVTMIRQDHKSKWKVDLVQELGLLENFLAARKTLDSMQEQAGEYAATWKAMDNQLNKKVVPEADKESKDQKKNQPKKPPKAQKKGPSARDD